MTSMLKESRDLEWIEMALSASFVGVLGGGGPHVEEPIQALDARRIQHCNRL